MLLPLQLLSIFFLPTLLVTGSPVLHKDSSPVNDAIVHSKSACISNASVSRCSHSSTQRLLFEEVLDGLVSRVLFQLRIH
ncbi:hypothetical protein FB446DRAFT_755286 [Lentinula raphanica]|nr:hypothetical protein FB446DRAFT_755286 [Lentinula raphanica]